MTAQHSLEMPEAPTRSPAGATKAPPSAQLEGDAALPFRRGRAAALRRSVRWAARAFGGVFVVGAAGACCGAVPLGFLLAAAAGAGLTAGLGVGLFALGTTAALAVLARRHRRARHPRACRMHAPVAGPDRRQRVPPSSTGL